MALCDEKRLYSVVRGQKMLVLAFECPLDILATTWQIEQDIFIP